MIRKWLAIGISTVSVIILILTSLTNVVGYQSVQTTQQNLIKERINQKELLFQTIVDIANNKEIQRIILKAQMSRGIFPTSEFPVVTKNQLKMMYLLGLILSKVVSKSRINSIVGMYQFSNQEIQKDITTVIEKDKTLNSEINQLKNSECDCESNRAMTWSFPIICGILTIIILGLFFIICVFGLISGLLQMVHLPGSVPVLFALTIVLLMMIIYIPVDFLDCPPIFYFP